MATKIVGEDGDLRWSPNSFGSYSVDKTQQIADILQQLMSTLTISVDIDDTSHRNYYTKQEIDEKLLLYFLKQDFQDFLGDRITDVLGSYITSQEAVGRIVTVETTNKMKKVINYLTKICFDETYDRMEAETEEITITPFYLRLDNLEGRMYTVEVVSNALASDLYDVPETRQGLRAVRKSDIVTVSTDSTTKVPSASLEYELRGIVIDLGDTVSTLNTTVSDMSGDVSDLGDTVSTLNTTVSDIQAPVSSLESAYDNWKDQVINKLVDLERRIVALENRS